MLVYLDSVVCIYAVEGDPPYRQRARDRLDALVAAGETPVVSDLVWVECCAIPMRSGDAGRLAAMEAFLRRPHFLRLPIGSAACERACRLIAHPRYKTIDALHLGIAIEGGCGLFLTNDQRIPPAPGIVVEALS